MTVSERCLTKLLPYILREKYINILALEMASRGNRHCANCIGTLSFAIVCVRWRPQQLQQHVAMTTSMMMTTMMMMV